MKLISEVLRMACVNRDHTDLPTIHTFIHEWKELSYIFSQPQTIIALRPVLISRPQGRRLSWPGKVYT